MYAVGMEGVKGRVDGAANCKATRIRATLFG
jgi:hypothetical protein